MGTTAPAGGVLGAGDTAGTPGPGGTAGGDRSTQVEQRQRRRALVLGAGVLALVAAIALSLAVGSHPIPLGRVIELLAHGDDSSDSSVVRELRVPRTVVVLAVGAALALAGAVMQCLTRNPLADPGLLGVNAGASVAVVLGVAIGGIVGVQVYLWYALAGAAVAAAAVYVLAGAGRHTASPARMALAGVSVSAALAAITQAVVLADQQAFNEFRYWVAGSVEGRGWPVLLAVAPFLVAGAAIAIALAPALNVLALGEDTGRALGVNVRVVRGAAMLAVTLLCGAATAAVGPIMFVGLAVPLAARAVLGPDQRWLSAACLLLGPTWLLLADVLARVLVAPQEVPVGVVAALAGGPVFVLVVRRPKVAAL
ncbi:MAG: iron ABC transporter permease [Nocardioidaceae bacterium]